MTKKLENGIYIDMTAEEIADLENLKNYHHNNMDILMIEIRTKRNRLLAETDYLALSDQTMSAEMITYRQALRDITNGLTTVADVEAVVFPEKPEV